MDNLLKKAVKEYQRVQNLKYNIQKPCIEIRVNSKKAIALLRRDNTKESEKMIKKAESLFRLVSGTVKKDKDLLKQGFYKEAVEEYIEALVFFNSLNKTNWEISDFIKAGPEEMISGICDFTGELVRKSITIGNVENLPKIILYKKVIEDIVDNLTQIGLSGKLRQKYDEVERNLRKIENILYDIKLSAR